MEILMWVLFGIVVVLFLIIILMVSVLNAVCKPFAELLDHLDPFKIR